MKKFYEVLRESFNVETLKNYRKVKTFDKLVDALVYARRYSKACGGKRQFLQMLVFEIQPDDGDYAPLTADFLMHADEAKLIYKADDDGVLHACDDDEAEQTSEADEADEVEPESKSVVAESTEDYTEPEKTEKSDAPEYSLQNPWGLDAYLKTCKKNPTYHRVMRQLLTQLADTAYKYGFQKGMGLDTEKTLARLDAQDLACFTVGIPKEILCKTFQVEQERGYEKAGGAPKIDMSYDMGYGTADYLGDTYILLGQPFEDNNGAGEAVFFAYAVKMGDCFDKDGNVKCYKLEFEIINPNWEGEGKEACDWYEASNVEFWNYVYYSYMDKQFIY